MSLLCIFDIDGTLTKDNLLGTKAYSSSIKTVFGAEGYNQDWGTYRYDSDIGIMREIVFSTLGHYPSQEQEEVFISEYSSRFFEFLKSDPDALQPLPGTIGFFNDVMEDKSSFPAIFSGGLYTIAQTKLKHIGLDESILFAANTFENTRLSILDKCVSNATTYYSTTFDEFVIFGDSKSDARISIIKSIPMIGVTTTIDQSTFNRHNVNYTIRDYRNIRIGEVKRYVNSRFK